MVHVPLIQFGLGGVGRALVERVRRGSTFYAQRYGIQLDYILLADSRSAAFNQRGFAPAELERMVQAKGQGEDLLDTGLAYYHGGLQDIVDIAGVPDAIVIDVTASDDTASTLLLALDRGMSVVTANKKPLAGPYADFLRLVGSGRCRYEATVGAGVPVIATLADNLLASADTVHKIEGCFSGTLGFLTTGIQAGSAFATLVREAKTRGYTEPDPRQDLSGTDVARKALILARTLGWPLELAQVQVESLYPPELEAGSVADFLAAIGALDAPYRQRASAAAAEGKALRYVARLAERTAQVGLQAAPLDSAVGRLQGTDNLVAFHTEIYQPQPLVLQGRGAGAHGTAAGVLADIIALRVHP